MQGRSSRQAWSAQQSSGSLNSSSRKGVAAAMIAAAERNAAVPEAEFRAPR